MAHPRAPNLARRTPCTGAGCGAYPTHLAPAGSDVPRRLTDPRDVGEDHVSQGSGRGSVGAGRSHAQSPEMAGPGGMARHPSAVAADAAPATLSDPAGRAAQALQHHTDVAVELY